MRILFVMNAFVCAGAEKLVMDLSRTLVKECEYVGIAALYRSDDDMQEQLRSGLQEQGIHTYILDKHAGKNRAATVQKLAGIVRSEQVELIHGHCSVPMLLSKLTGLLTGVKVVSTVHNTRGYSLLREKLTGWMAAAYVSIGAAAETYMVQSLKIPQRKITRIYNAVDTVQFLPGNKREGFWTRWGLDGKIPVIVNVGRVVEQKNQMCLLRALKQCIDQGNPMQCVFLGKFDPNSHLYQRMCAFIQDNGIEQYVRFLGQQVHVAEFLVNSDCFVMTSFYEGLSVSFLEAVSCGIPIVVTQMPFVEELNEIAPCGRIIPQDDDGMLSRVLMARDYDAPTEHTLAVFRDRFSLQSFASQHLALYQRVLDEHR